MPFRGVPECAINDPSGAVGEHTYIGTSGVPHRPAARTHMSTGSIATTVRTILRLNAWAHQLPLHFATTLDD